MSCFSRGPATLREYFQTAHAHLDRDFLVFGEERFTFERFFAVGNALADQLVTALGCVPGDRVAVGMRNYPEW